MKGFWIICSLGAALIGYVAVFSPKTPSQPVRTLGDVWREECAGPKRPAGFTFDECVFLKGVEKSFKEINKQ
jgi:hypothetical protein